MICHDVTLDLADLAALAAGSTITLPADGVTFEVTSEDAWTASSDPGVCRFALSPDQLDRLRWGRPVTALPVGVNGPVHFSVDTAAVVR
jgi:hypothetical protein